MKQANSIEALIRTLRGQKVIMDRDFANLYGVPTSRLNEAVKRNRRRFPSDFAFQVKRQELASLMPQNAISSSVFPIFQIMLRKAEPANLCFIERKR